MKGTVPSVWVAPLSPSFCCLNLKLSLQENYIHIVVCFHIKFVFVLNQVNSTYCGCVFLIENSEMCKSCSNIYGWPYPLGHRDNASNYSTYMHLKMLVTKNG